VGASALPNTPLRVVLVDSVDQPWFEGRFERLDGFDTVSRWFERDLLLLDQQRWDEFEQLWGEIRGLGLRLQRPATEELVNEFLLRVQDDRAWFRY